MSSGTRLVKDPSRVDANRVDASRVDASRVDASRVDASRAGLNRLRRGKVRRRERGSAAIEMAVLMPMFLVLFTGAVVLGRTANTISAVEAAAYDAARTASIARDAGTAEAQASATVWDSLSDHGVSCVDGPVVVVDTGGFAADVGTPASVTVTVTCQVTFTDIDLIGVPADRPITASFVSPIDQYRAR